MKGKKYTEFFKVYKNCIPKCSGMEKKLQNFRTRKVYQNYIRKIFDQKVLRNLHFNNNKKVRIIFSFFKQIHLLPTLSNIMNESEARSRASQIKARVCRFHNNTLSEKFQKDSKKKIVKHLFTLLAFPVLRANLILPQRDWYLLAQKLSFSRARPTHIMSYHNFLALNGASVARARHNTLSHAFIYILIYNLHARALALSDNCVLSSSLSSFYAHVCSHKRTFSYNRDIQ